VCECGNVLADSYDVGYTLIGTKQSNVSTLTSGTACKYRCRSSVFSERSGEVFLSPVMNSSRNPQWSLTIRTRIDREKQVDKILVYQNIQSIKADCGLFYKSPINSVTLRSDILITCCCSEIRRTVCWYWNGKTYSSCIETELVMLSMYFTCYFVYMMLGTSGDTCFYLLITF